MTEKTSSRIVRNVSTVMLVGLMTLCAEITHIKEFIFPEIGALCIGHISSSWQKLFLISD